MKHPSFCVVGHPNKGKSSIVASLALDDTVAISNIPGTTHYKRSYPLQVDGKVVYELFDTPGFQRARRVLAWLEQHEVSADKKHEVVRAFVNEHRDDPKFHDEIELLEPILDGAGIIYVVDASKPYSSEYEAEMEILRWCNQPSMALINHIENDDYSDEWKRALGYYFKLIRTYNPMQASFKEQLHILESMAHLNEEWTESVKESIVLFKQYHEQMIQKSALLISELIEESITHIEKTTLHKEDVTEADKSALEQKYKQRLRDMETASYKKIEAVWNYQHLQKESFLLPFEEIDLFSEEAASIFGLTKKELLFSATTSGAITGAGVDMIFAGHTAFLGALIGGVVGATGAYFGFDELSEVKILGQKLGQRYLQMGPMKNRNFPYILLSRALLYTTKLMQRSHAKRDILSLHDGALKEQLLDEKLKKSLEKYHKKFRKAEKLSYDEQKEYQRLLEESLKRGCYGYSSIDSL